MLPSVDIIIVNWNSGTQLYECLSSIASNEQNEFQLGKVIIVDNASIDRSLDSLDDFNLPIDIIKNQKNKGFGAACNQGAAISQANYFLFLNPDTRLSNNSLDRSVEFMEDSLKQQVGVVGIQLVDDRGKIQRSCARFPSPINFWCSILGIDKLITNKFTSYPMADWSHDVTQEVDHVMGAFYLIRSNVFKLLNGFDEDFFVYFEDLDLSYRLHKLGWSSYYLADVKSFHKGGGTSEQIKATRLFYSLRSRILYGYKHFSSIHANTIAVASLTIEPFTRIAFSILKLSASQAKETIQGYIKIFANLQEMQRLIKQ
jgi:N-acetylglucosaminyl-diphospho-decaprenol L-rhamnosyltransferase